MMVLMLIGVILQSVEVLLKVLDLLKKKREQNRNHP